jgi:hypothetical protein
MQTYYKLYMHIYNILLYSFFTSFDLITTTLFTWEVAHQMPDSCQ